LWLKTQNKFFFNLAKVIALVDRLIWRFIPQLLDLSKIRTD
jgi:hypothetical protein